MGAVKERGQAPFLTTRLLTGMFERCPEWLSINMKPVESDQLKVCP
jgi:hypothetical protein